MVHTFSCLDKLFALDVESGSCFEIDDVVKELLKRRSIDEKNSLQKNNAEGFFVQSDIDQANDEIDALIKKGSLFSKAKPMPLLQINTEVKALCVNISHKCNLACAYCFAGGGDYHSKKSTSKNMSLETAKACIDFLIQNSGNKKNLEIDFFGGEPLLNYQTIKDAIAYGRQQEKLYNKLFKFTITTNGLSLTDEMIEFFNQEIFNVVISIDGREHVHNLMRPDIDGQPSFNKILKNAKEFKKKRKGSYYIRGTFTAKNLDFSKDIIALADLGFDQISLEPVVLPCNHPLALREEHLPILLEQYELLAKEYLKRKNFSSSFFSCNSASLPCHFEQGEALQPFNFFHFNIDLKGGPCLKKRLSGCGVGGEYLCVSVDGSIYPCHRFDGMEEYRMGSVNKEKLLSDDIKLNHEPPSVNQELSHYFQKSNLLSKPHCQNCFAKYFCSGGCNANNLEYGGDINAAHKMSCELMKKRIECAIAIKVLNS